MKTNIFSSWENISGLLSTLFPVECINCFLLFFFFKFSVGVNGNSKDISKLLCNTEIFLLHLQRSFIF